MTKDEALRLAREALLRADRLMGKFPQDDKWREHDRNIALAAIDAALAERDEMPELPSICNGVGDYTADQMRAYGRACAEATRKKDKALMRQALDRLTKARQCVSAAYSPEHAAWAGELDGTIAALRERLGEKKE